MIPDVKPELSELVKNIAQRNMYGGNKIPDSIMKMFEVIETEYSAGIMVPFWISVLQKGRGPRRSNTDSGLWKKIYRWMEKRAMFRSKTAKGRINEARSLTWYINKYGNQHFRSKVFVDVYNEERKKTIEKINKKYSEFISKITMEVI
jgi:hypothetical protein